MVNEHFIQSELEYRRQERLAAAAQHRRAKSAMRVRTLRSRFTSAVEHVVPGRAARAGGTPHAA